MIQTPPGWQGQARVLLRGGTVYSPEDPFATAMLVQGSEVAWVGGDGAALAMSDGVDEVVELDGCLVTPAFVDAHTDSGAIGDGVAMAQVFSADPLELDRKVNAAPGPLIDPYLTDGATDRFGGCVTVGPRTSARIVEAVRWGVLLVVLADGTSQLRQAVAALDHARAEAGSLRGVRLDALGVVPLELVPAIAALGIPVVVRPDQPQPPPFAALAAAGVPLAFGSGAAGVQPWRAVAAAVNHPDPAQRISARAGFAAHTRGGWRAAGLPSNGALVPGAPAHYVLWQVGELRVQAPDERIQAWSTDPRSGTPGLPDLSPGAVEPKCIRTVVWGRTIPS